MDDLYSNLENYDDVNALVELRKENATLKQKIEDYVVSMEKLQKDFDKVTMEFKRLETNYSSLLRTARAEIERKTQTIINLNKEKDMLVLKTRQSGNRSMFNYNRRNQSFDRNKSQNSDSESCKGNKKDGRESQSNLKTNIQDFTNERKELRHTPFEESNASSNTDNTCKLMNRLTEGCGSSSERNGEAKENMGLQKQDIKATKACSIRNRRKSMPAASFRDGNPKFSSDEEDHYNNAKEENKFEFLRKAPDRPNLIRSHIEKYVNKLPEAQNLQERPYGTHDLRESFKSRNNRNYDNDRYRSREKYDSRKSRRRYSPDRSHWRPSRDYHDNNHRPEYNRQRHLETPPPSKSTEPNWLLRSREHNQQRAFNNQASNCSKNNGVDDNVNHPGKHRVASEFVEEPARKRPRFNSSSAHHDESQWIHEKAVMPAQNVCELLQEDHFVSCQSPDLLHYDLPPDHGHVPKEIRVTAVTQLDDPRETSKKYVIESNNDKTTLLTVGSRNINILPIDKSGWEIESTFYVPSLLRQPPSDINESLGKAVSMDVDNALSNTSIESGEIVPVSKNCSSVKEKCASGDSGGSNITPVVTETESIPKEENPPKALSKRFRIPKVKQCDSEQPPLIDTKLPKSPAVKKHEHKGREERSVSQILSKHCDKRLLQPDVVQNQGNNVHGPNKPVETNVNNNIEGNKQLQCDKPRVLSSREMVEVDLELSDDNSDNAIIPQTMDKDTVNRQTSFDSIQTKPIEDMTKKIVEQVQENTGKSVKPKDSEKVEKLASHKKDETEVKVKDTNKKKHKEKKRSSKSKDTSTSESATAPVTQKKRTKKEKDKPKVIQNKFCDLFGDSSSLITPEDLGVQPPPVDVNLPSSNTCVPFFEDAQDAIDVETIKAQALAADDAKLTNITSKPSCVDNPYKGTTVNINITEEPLSIDKEEPNVKTVIISTGLQPQIPVRTADESNSHVENIRNSVLVKNPDLSLKALATSTPHKPIEPISAAVYAAASSDLSDTNTLDSQTDTDVPDVRIFVRRRRKVIKKT